MQQAYLASSRMTIGKDTSSMTSNMEATHVAPTTEKQKMLSADHQSIKLVCQKLGNVKFLTNNIRLLDQSAVLLSLKSSHSILDILTLLD
jgi:hypothetical protein